MKTEKKDFRKKNFKGGKRNGSGKFSNTDNRSASDVIDSSKSLDLYKSKPNDWHWYAQNEQLLKDVASYAYGYALGGKYKTLGIESPLFPEYTTPSQNANSVALPGILALRLIPTIGYSDNANSPINICARNLYTFIRAANSGAKNYDSADLILYLTAMDSAYSYLSWMKRLYGLIGISNIENRYFPWAAVTAAGGIYSDLRNNLADFRAYINMFAVRLASMCIPNSMSYLRRHQWIYEGIYMDTDHPKSQAYLFAPEGFHVFGLDSDGAGACLFKSFDAFGMDGSFDAIKRYGNAILGPILNGAGEEDFNLISGDILKAYGENGVYRAEMISEDYVVVPSYDLSALGQIQNARTMPFIIGDTTNDHMFDFTQDASKNFLVSKPKVDLSWCPRGASGGWNEGANVPMASIYRGNYLINTYNDNPGPADSMEYTRLANMIGDDGAIYTLGSEICTRFYFYYFMETSNGWDLVQSSANRNDIPLRYASKGDPTTDDPTKWNEVLTPGSVATAMEKMSQISAFRYHPYQYVILTDSTDGSGPAKEGHGTFYPTAPIGDTNVYTLIDNENLRMMSEVALMSEFGLETYGR